MKSTASADLKLLMSKKSHDLKTHQWVYQLLRNNLLCGRIEPGKPLTIRGLAEILKVSPMPVREALHRLACEAAVEVKNNRRVIVPLMTAEKFSELCDLRILLETHAAEGALPYIKEEDIDILEKLDAKIDEAVENDDADYISLYNQQFHRHLYSANPFQISVPLIESLWLQLGPFSRIAIEKLEKTYLVDRHAEALEALRKRNSFGLRRAIEADIRDGIASINTVEGIHDYFRGVA
ncbi:MAG: GntR family transcriptional regulator [Gammaproteobacteria bacterium]|nr:GntR family transcriptional regulator [Gammaproteobacteria bacterium]MDH3535662.1 GntR family transcriptional regulator [Gammaproteobacteria bacterium]